MIIPPAICAVDNRGDLRLRAAQPVAVCEKAWRRAFQRFLDLAPFGDSALCLVDPGDVLAIGALDRLFQANLASKLAPFLLRHGD
jgi:hypothetical protein